MLGNDVVDLRDSGSGADARHPRFDARAFAPEERARIARSGAPERLRWVLWSAKEAAYKVARKLDARSVFAPARYAVRLDASLRGEVALPDGRRIAVRVRSDAECVHAVASERPDFEQGLVEGLAALGACTAAEEGARTRELATRAIAHALCRPESEIAIDRRGRIPELRVAGVRCACDLTLSHHGRFGAFACELGRPLPARAVRPA
jgi:hypothetical protein